MPVTGMTIIYPVVSSTKYSRHVDKVWGLIKSVKKGGLLLILGTETTPKGQVWTCLGALGLAISMRPSYPIWLCHSGGSNSCTMSAPVPRRHTTVVWVADRGSSSSRSFRSGVVGWINTFLPSLLSYYLSIFYPYLMLTLDLSSNSWYQSSCF